MALCKDDITTHAKKFNYNIIYPPRTDATPLEVLTKQDSSLLRWGHLSDVINSSMPLPVIHENNNPLNIEGVVSSSHDSTVGIAILGKLISAVGGNLGIKTAYKNAKRLNFQYRDVTSYYVMPVDLDRYISNGVPDSGLYSTAEMLQKDKLFIFTAVLKAKKIIVEANKEGGGSIEVDVLTIKEIVGGNIAVSAENAENTKISYQGKIPAGFGFQAILMDFDDGKIILKPSGSGKMVAAEKGEAVEPDSKYETMVFDEDYVSLP
ncbi:MAG: hypothetical protein C4563_07215 [Desulfobulbus sp.]|nr:MAG: hypothetical protein C4563_07215 [Desulfobulbus sp.]